LPEKAEPAYRFYLLYDKIHRPDILEHAFALARENDGALGVDGVTFETIEAAGVEGWLAALRHGRRKTASLRSPMDLASKTYRPMPVRRVMIPKPGGGERPLGIPTIRDRVVQTAANPRALTRGRSSRRTWKTAPMVTGPNEARSMPSRLRTG
jgi:RNA-directed DNA polymerase